MTTSAKIDNIDASKQKRFDQLKRFFTTHKTTYIKEKGYYIELRHFDASPGTRFYFHDKWKVELVVDHEDSPSRNICDFVLFSNIDDAIMYAVLKEETHLNTKKAVKVN